MWGFQLQEIGLRTFAVSTCVLLNDLVEPMIRIAAASSISSTAQLHELRMHHLPTADHNDIHLHIEGATLASMPARPKRKHRSSGAASGESSDMEPSEIDSDDLADIVASGSDCESLVSSGDTIAEEAVEEFVCLVVVGHNVS